MSDNLPALRDRGDPNWRERVNAEKAQRRADFDRWLQEARDRPIDVDAAIRFASHLPSDACSVDEAISFAEALSTEELVRESLNYASFVRAVYGPLGNRGSGKGRTKTLYAFLAPTLGRVKLGVADNVEKRFGDIRHLCPVEMHVVATKVGTHKDEQALHRRFAAYRVRGEWFRYEGEVRDEIATWEPWS